MPFPIPSIPDPVSPAGVLPRHIRQTESWAIEQERYRHDLPLYTLGEYSIFYLMWSLLDFEAGVVTRCARCYGTSGTVARREADVYNQPSINRCPDCFGTTFEGGYRARIVRPALWSDNDESEKQDRRGTIHPENTNVESTWDFRMRQGDYILRADGSRWRLSDSPRRTTLRTGFDHPSQKDTAITYAQMRARLEEPGTVVYDLVPTSKVGIHTLLSDKSHFPRDFSDFEIIRGPLVPTDGVID